MKWFWDQYEPDINKRKSILATPLNATIEQLKNLPPTMILNGEADVLRDEGEAYANKLSYFILTSQLNTKYKFS